MKYKCEQLMNIRKMDSDGRVTIPYEFRRVLLEVQAGDNLLIIGNLKDKTITIKKYE